MFEARAAALLANGEVYSGDVGGMTAVYRHLERCDPETDILIAERDGRIVGYSRVEWQDTNDGERWYVGICLIEPGSRRQGHRPGDARLERTPADRQRPPPPRLGRRPGRAPDLPHDVRHGRRPGRDEASSRASATSPSGRSSRCAARRSTTSPRRPCRMDSRSDRSRPSRPRCVGCSMPTTRPSAITSAGRKAVDEIFAAILEDPSTDPSLWVVAFDGDRVAGGDPERAASATRRAGRDGSMARLGLHVEDAIGVGVWPGRSSPAACGCSGTSATIGRISVSTQATPTTRSGCIDPRASRSRPASGRIASRSITERDG